ncbi:MAG: tetratricopeptide repeat protein [Bryobacterales bacterium]|nr:tetratricopeptide repeat protein [Bryobacterales bacterium]
MPLPYREFCEWILGDLARRGPSKHEDRVVFEGNHISHQMLRPIQSPDESDEDYRQRVRAFQRALPRASDFSRRIALAFEAFSRAGDKSLVAAHFILERLDGAVERSRALKNELAELGLAYRPLDVPLGTTKRHLRRRPKTSRLSMEDARVETIRTQALRFMRKCAGFDQLFEREFRRFRAEYYRDAEWCGEEEVGLRANLKDCEAQLGPTDPWTAMMTRNLARLLQKQGKVEEAESVFRLALERWKSASSVPDERRREAIGSIEQALSQLR